MKPPPAATKSTMALFWAPEKSSSPLVSAKQITSYAARLDADTVDRFSVVVTVNSPVDAARPVMIWRAVGIESCLNAAVAVIISTRLGARPGTSGWMTAPGPTVRSLEEHAPTKRTTPRSQRHTTICSLGLEARVL